MVDLALMSKLMQAVAPDARLLVLGDKNQLASVEAGSVLGDVCHGHVSHGFSQGFLEQIVRYSGIVGEEFTQLPGNRAGLQDCICILPRSG